MICLLTSSIVIPGTETLNPANGLIDELRSCFPKNCRGLFICSDPDDTEKADFYEYIRGLDSLKKSLSGTGRKTLVLDRNSELVQILYGN